MGSSGEYQLSVILKTIDQMSGGLNKGVSNVRRFGRETKQALDTYRKFRTEVGRPLNTSGLDRFDTKLHKVTTDIKALAREQGKLGKRYDKLADNTGLDRQLQQLRTYRREMRAVARDSQGMRSAMRSGRGGRVADPLDELSPLPRRRRIDPLLGRLGAAGELYMVGQQAAGVWRDRIDSLHKYTDETMRLYQAQAKFQAINLSPDENLRALDAVRQTVREVKGLSLTGVTETLTDLHTATGDLGHAIEALPLASKYRFSFETLFGDKFSSDEIETQIQQGFKFLEMTGKVAKGREEMERTFNVMAQMSAATGGRVNPSEMLGMARRGGMALQGLTVEGLRNLSAPIQELGGEGAGTSMMSLYQALVGGTMRKSSLAEFARLGLIDPSKIETGKHSDIIKKVLPGGNRLGAALQQDPLKAADMLMQAMAAKGVNTTDENKVREELAILFQNRTAQRMMSILTTQRQQVLKEAGLAAHAKDIDQLNKQALESPMGQIVQYQKAIENWKAATGMSLVEVGIKLTKEWTPFVNLLSEHPNISLGLVGAQKAAGGLLESFALLNQFRVARSLNEIATSADMAAGGMSRAERNAIGLGNKMSWLGSLKLAGAIAGITLLGDALIEVDKQASSVNEQFEKNRRLAKETYDILVATGQLYSKPGKDKSTAEQGKGLLQRLNASGELTDALKPMDWKEYIPFMGKRSGFFPDKYLPGSGLDLYGKLRGGAPYAPHDLTGVNLSLRPGARSTYDTDVAARRMESLIPEAHDPQVMARIIKEALAGGLGSSVKDEGINRFMESLKTFDSKAFNEAMGLVAGETKSLAEQTNAQTFAFKQMLNPSNQLTPALGRAVIGLDSFSNRLGNFSIPTFNVGSPIQNNVYNPTGSTTQSSSTFDNRGFTRIPHKASGGDVLSDGLAFIHKREKIVPARVTARWRDDQVRPVRVSQSRPVHVTVNVHGDVRDPDRMANKLANKIMARLNQVESKVDDPRHVGRMRDIYNEAEDERS